MISYNFLLEDILSIVHPSMYTHHVCVQRACAEREKRRREAEKAKEKFSVYMNPALLAALTTKNASSQPSSNNYTIHFLILFFYIAVGSALAFLLSWEEQLIHSISFNLNFNSGLDYYIAYLLVKMMTIIMGLVFIASTLVCFNLFVLHLHGVRFHAPKAVLEDQTPTLTVRQQRLLGLKPKAVPEQSSTKREPLFPLHHDMFPFTASSMRWTTGYGYLRNISGGEKKMRLVNSPKTPIYLVPGCGLLSSLAASSTHHSPSFSFGSVVSTQSPSPTLWSHNRITPTISSSLDIGIARRKAPYFYVVRYPKLL